MHTKLALLTLVLLGCLAAATAQETAEAPSWDTHPGWDILAGGDATSAVNSFGQTIAAVPRKDRDLEWVEGARLGWVIALSRVAIDMLHRAAEAGPEDPSGLRARKLLELLWQEDPEALKRWRGGGDEPWKEPLARLLDLRPPAKSGLLILPPRIAFGPDGTVYRWAGPARRNSSSGRLTIDLPSGESVDLSVPCRLASPDDVTQVALSPDGSRFFVATPATTTCFETSRLRAGEVMEAWTHRLENPTTTTTAVVVTSDSKRLIFANTGAGIGILDAATGDLIQRVQSDEYDVLPYPTMPAAVNADRSSIFLPVALARVDQPPQLPGGGTYTPFEQVHKYARIAEWLTLDADTGLPTGRRRNPWAPESAFGGPTHSTRWEYTHAPPSPWPVYPPGPVCVSHRSTVFLVDPQTLEIAAAVAVPGNGHGVYEGAGGQPGSQFPPPVRALLTDEEYDAARQAYELVATEAAGLSQVLQWIDGTPAKSLLAGVGLLASAVSGPWFPDAGWKGSKWLTGKVKHRIRPPESREVYTLECAPRHWRPLWVGHLREFTFEAREPPGANKPELLPPLVEDASIFVDYVKIPVRFKPGGVEAGRDGRWLYAVAEGGLMCVDAELGTPWLVIEKLVWWDLIALPGTDRALALGGPGRYGITEIDLIRGCGIRSYDIGPIVFAAVPASGGPLLLIPDKYLEKGAWLLDAETGCVPATSPPPPMKGPKWDWLKDRFEGCLGISEDGLRAMIPLITQRKVRRDSIQVPLWAEMRLETGEITRMLEGTEVVTEEGLALVEQARIDNSKLRQYVPASMFPLVERRWTISRKGDVYLAGAPNTRLVRVQRVRSTGGGYGSVGTTTTTITIFR